MTDLIDVIYSRRSIRKYKDTPLTKDILETILKAAMAAPTATNAQPWEFVVITEPETLAALRGSTLFSRINAPGSHLCARQRTDATEQGRLKILGSRLQRSH